VESQQKGGNWTQANNGPMLQGAAPQNRFKGDVDAARAPEMKKMEQGACLRCGAWRGQLGAEPTIEMYVAHIVEVFREVRRVLRVDGVLWLNCGDSFCSTPDRGLKAKDLIGMPWRVAFALQSDGWWLRQEIIWAKPAPMPESVLDRCTRSHEYLFMLTKSQNYYYDAEAIKEPGSLASIARINQPGFDQQTGGPKDPLEGNRSARRALKNLADKQRGHAREHVGFNDVWDQMTKQEQCGLRVNKRSVWTIPSEALPFEHFATYPQKLVEPCVLAGTSERGACEKCGAPWKRMLRKKSYGGWHSHENDAEQGNSQDGAARKKKYNELWEPPATVGWEPTCKCGAPTVPCTVLDPFLGSGTTALVALRAGRNFLGIELSEKYIAIAESRIAQEKAQMRLF
jgi:DNA modification methylase